MHCYYYHNVVHLRLSTHVSDTHFAHKPFMHLSVMISTAADHLNLHSSLSDSILHCHLPWNEVLTPSTLLLCASQTPPLSPTEQAWYSSNTLHRVNHVLLWCLHKWPFHFSDVFHEVNATLAYPMFKWSMPTFALHADNNCCFKNLLFCTEI